MLSSQKQEAFLQALRHDVARTLLDYKNVDRQICS